eukprot:tig00000342_g24198.t1
MAYGEETQLLRDIRAIEENILPAREQEFSVLQQQLAEWEAEIQASATPGESGELAEHDADRFERRLEAIGQLPWQEQRKQLHALKEDAKLRADAHELRISELLEQEALTILKETSRSQVEDTRVALIKMKQALVELVRPASHGPVPPKDDLYPPYGMLVDDEAEEELDGDIDAVFEPYFEHEGIFKEDKALDFAKRAELELFDTGPELQAKVDLSVGMDHDALLSQLPAESKYQHIARMASRTIAENSWHPRDKMRGMKFLVHVLQDLEKKKVAEELS